jgi:hypothetical protein
VDLTKRERDSLEALADLREDAGDAICELLRAIARGYRKGDDRLVAFVGGPLDGQYRIVENSRRNLIVPVLRPFDATLLKSGEVVDASMGYDAVNYYRRRITINGSPYQFEAFFAEWDR